MMPTDLNPCAQRVLQYMIDLLGGIKMNTRKRGNNDAT